MCLPVGVIRILWGGAFVVFWSSGFVGARLASGTDPVAVLGWRYLATALVLLLVTLARRRRPRVIELRRQAVQGLLAHVLFLGSVFGATALGVSPGTVALVCATQPLLVILGGWLFWREPPGGRVVAGLAVGLAAVGVTVGLDAGAGWAVLLPVLGVLALSTAALLERRWPAESDLLTALTIQTVTAAAAFGGYAALSGHLLARPSGSLVGAIVWLVLLSGIGGYAAFLGCLRRFGPARTSSLLFLTPPVTTLWAWLLFAQPPTVHELAGLLLGAGAVVLAIRGLQPHPSTHEDCAPLR